jgi:SAM-dependent methyltransferase
VTAGSPLPYPPRSLMNRVCSLEGQEDPVTAYETAGAEARTALLALLGDDWSFQGKRVLDFGCGAGRALRQFATEASEGELWGVDIDPRSIDWMRFWALSVFTHLTDNSLPWLVELHRLLRPGGLLIATYMGRFNGQPFTHEPWDEDRIGMNVLRRELSWDQGGPVVLTSDWWVRAHWGRAFDFVDEAAVHGQTWVLLRKRNVEVSVSALARPEDDPREYRALAHNLRQVEREKERLVAELRASYEGSLTWRLTSLSRGRPPDGPARGPALTTLPDGWAFLSERGRSLTGVL